VFSCQNHRSFHFKKELQRSFLISKIDGNSEITEEIILKELKLKKQISVEEIQLLSESKLEVFNDQKTFVSCVGRFGSLFASQVNLLRFLVWGPLPYDLFALNAILAAISMSFLPNEMQYID